MPEQLAGDKEALRLAWDEVSSRDLDRLAESSGAVVDPSSGHVMVKLIDRDCAVDLQSRTISYRDDGTPVKPHVQVLLIHYLLGAGNASPSGNMVTFREFPGGALYYPAYRKRTIDLIVSRFGDDPGRLADACERAGGTPLGKGTVGYRMRFLPKLHLDVLLWAGDDEVPTSANILFDECAGKMLSTEGITVVAGVLCSRLIALSRA